VKVYDKNDVSDSFRGLECFER